MRNTRIRLFIIAGLLWIAIIAHFFTSTKLYCDPEQEADQENAADYEEGVFSEDSDPVGPDDEICPIVCLDPGHPSEVNDGMTQQNGVTENHINWIVASELAEALESQGVAVVMTKSSEDESVTNTERARIANNSIAALFFRIHCDSGSAETRGMTFYYPDRQGSWDGNTGPPEEIIPACREAAYTIHDIAMEKMDGLLIDRGVLTDNETYIGSRQGGALRGSILSEVPVILVELCFLSNPEDVVLITDPDLRRLIVEALTAGIIEYLGTESALTQ